MELKLKKVGIINEANVKLSGLTVICGNNNSGKSTVGKALYATIEALSNLDVKLHKELVESYRTALLKVSRILGLEDVAKYLDLDKMHAHCGKDFSILIDRVYSYRKFLTHENVIEAYVLLKEIIEALNPQLLTDFTKKLQSDLPKKFFAYLENLEENKNKALSFLGDFDKYFFHDDSNEFAAKSVAALFSAEFSGQVFPVNLMDENRESLISISKNGEIGSSLLIHSNMDIIADVKERKLFLNNAIYVDDPYALDRLVRDDEMAFLYSINRMNRMDQTHFGKLSRLLLKNAPTSLIEASINKEKYDSLVAKISKVIPGSLAIKDSGIYYEETGKEPLKVQNLATGSKMFSIIKSLLEKGEINFDTMLILDEPEAHLHPKWQNIFAEIMVLIVKEFNAHVLLTTHSPNFLMAIEAYAKKYNLSDKSNYYWATQNETEYMVDYICVNSSLSKIYSSFAQPLIDVKTIKEEE